MDSEVPLAPSYSGPARLEIRELRPTDWREHPRVIQAATAVATPPVVSERPKLLRTR